ncbi:hypothetical protein GT755_00200 [Herbidospora sp. NEAU-GS84]|uniref:Uncharacterized protein n=1 Tax=Herbidospora solisilvae TaxID=2696284 RepID=A0A7C9J0D4_9ACTN|nr:hypothetical protein [Herbidospora solisilvae]NAS20100.1 hypothetical protein [Herbidospora solisilvae]
MSEVSKIGIWFWSIVAVGVPAAWIGTVAVAPFFSDRVVEVDDAVRGEIAAGLGIVDMYEGGTNGAGRITFEGEFIVLRTTVGRQLDTMMKAGWTRGHSYGNLVSGRLNTRASVEPLTVFIEAHREDFLGHGQAADRFAGSIADPENHVVVSLDSLG